MGGAWWGTHTITGEADATQQPQRPQQPQHPPVPPADQPAAPPAPLEIVLPAGNMNDANLFDL
eukprot:8649069-Alexandrium_andersonii.AAC.1